MFGLCVGANASILLLVCGADTVPTGMQGDAACVMPFQNGCIEVIKVIVY